MNKLLYFISLLCLLLSSCVPYTRYYGTTHTQISTSKSIRRLDLSHQNIQSLPEEMQPLTKLKMLDLSGNKALNLEYALDQIAESNPKLEILILDSLDVHTLPKSIQKFPHLKQLSLAYNPNIDLKLLSTTLTPLSIQFLNLKGNQITALPQEFKGLQSLKDLNLAENRLHDPQSYRYLAALPNLYSLWLDRNELVELPKTIGDLTQLRCLYLDHNQLSKLPNTMKGMKKLWILHIGHNQLETLPEVFTEMNALLLVHANNNNIHQIPEQFATAKYPLAGLLLDHNPLSPQTKENAKHWFKGFFMLSFETVK